MAINTIQNDLCAWWQGIAALPANREEQAYFALRRIWADQTINTTKGTRGFYRWGTEDNLTPALWQSWAIFEDPNATSPFLRAAGAPAGNVTRVQWAYACEELPKFGPKVIPDIMLQYEDEAGRGLLAMELKKPGTAAKLDDVGKLKQYLSLPSTRGISRRNGCFLVSEGVLPATRKNTGDTFPTMTWEALREFQLSAARVLPIDPSVADLVAAWVARNFARHGIGSPISPPSPRGQGYGHSTSYDAIRSLNLPGAIERFLMGSECVEASRNGTDPSPPFTWLANEPTVADVTQPNFQSTADRRVNRWKFEWTLRLEHSR